MKLNNVILKSNIIYRRIFIIIFTDIRKFKGLTEFLVSFKPEKCLKLF